MVEGNVLTLGLKPETHIVKKDDKPKIDVGNQVTQTKPSMWDSLLRD